MEITGICWPPKDENHSIPKPSGKNPLEIMSMQKIELASYRERLVEGMKVIEKSSAWLKIIKKLADVRGCQNTLFFAGNGGSAANANHLATDLIYGADAAGRGAFRVHSLAANSSILTCLGNDTGYENIFAKQLEALARAGDLLFVFSGSGNSPNILRVLKAARKLRVFSISFLGFDGGKAKKMSDLVLHFPIHDMQVVEDLHMIAGHLILKALQ